MPSEIQSRAEKAIQEKVFPGCVVGVVKKDGERTVLPFGNFTYESNSPRVAEDTIYDLASITKSIPTASLALMLIAEGKFALADKVSAYIPELKNDREATIEDLLTYRVLGPRMSTLKDKSADEIARHAFDHGFDGPPGTSRYTNLPAFLLGLIVERVGGGTLDALAQTYFFDPLGMRDTTFFPNYRPTRSIIAPTEVIDGKEICGIVHDESARVFAKAGRAVGHAGLFSTVPDLLNFLESLLHGDEGFTKSIIAGAEQGLGWQVNDAQFMGKHACLRTFGKTGFTGTSAVVDTERGTAFVILSNRTYPERPADGKAIDAFRRDIADVVLK